MIVDFALCTAQMYTRVCINDMYLYISICTYVQIDMHLYFDTYTCMRLSYVFDNNVRTING